MEEKKREYLGDYKPTLLNKIKYKFWRVRDWYWGNKNWLKNCFRYRNVLKDTHEFDYSAIHSFTKKHLTYLLKEIQDGRDYGQEVDETRIPKEKAIQRCIDILIHIDNDDYKERCGYDFDYKIYFEDCVNEDYSEMKDTLTEAQKIHNDKASEKANKLETSEWNELFRLMRDGLKGWWV